MVNTTGAGWQDEIGQPLGITPNKGFVTQGVEPAVDPPHNLVFTGPTLVRNPSSNSRLLGPNSVFIVEGMDFGQSHLYGQIIRIPVSIDGGFIVEDTDFDFELWNYKNKIANVTNISYDPGQTGLNLSISGVPFTIPIGGSEQSVLTILEDGPATQDTTITFTIDGEPITLDIDAIRVVAVPYEPNWSDKPVLDLVYETVMFQTERHSEQRRPLLTEPRRVVEFLIQEDSNRAQRLVNLLVYGKDKIFGVPIVHEVFWVTNADQDDTVLTTAASIQYYWNLQNQCDFVMLFDFTTNEYEIKELSSVSNSDVTLVTGLTQTFDVNKTVVFPVFLAYIDRTTFDGDTFEHDSTKVRFMEL